MQRTLLCLILPLLLAGGPRGQRAGTAADRGGWRSGTASAGGGRRISVVTLNVAKETSVPRIAGELRSIPALRDADLYLLQEVADGTAQALARELGLRAARAPEAPGVRDTELAILSRYPLRDVRVRQLPRYDLVFHSRSRFALSAVAETPWRALPIVNTHLDTRLNAADRLAQLEAVASGDAAIVAGDFNSNPFYWVDHVLPLPMLHSQAASVEDYMGRLGYRSAIPRSETTFDYLGMHLDWIWVRGLRAGAHAVYPLKFSDHHACWTSIAAS